MFAGHDTDQVNVTALPDTRHAGELPDQESGTGWMNRIVMKFGGTSVDGLERIRNAASRVQREVQAGNQVIAVVSAMAGKTSELADTVRALSPIFDAREYDAVVSSGENVTAGLMAMALQDLGIPARSWQGWQIPVRTNSAHGAAKIEEICTDAICSKFDEGMQVAVVAGFQGVTSDQRISTLGRGGSDTSAVALAAAFDCQRCDICTDVSGVFTADPRLVSTARRLDRVSYEEMMELASLGAKVLHTRSVELAMHNNVRLRVMSSFSDEPGTSVCNEEDIMEARAVSGVAHSRNEAKITLISVADRPGIAATIFGRLAAVGVVVDMIVQNISEEGRTDITFSCPVEDVSKAEQALNELLNTGEVRYREMIKDTEVCKLSVVGIGMRSQSGVAAKMFRALAEENINIAVIATSEIKISVLIGRKYMELGVQALHDAFGLDKG